MSIKDVQKAYDRLHNARLKAEDELESFVNEIRNEINELKEDVEYGRCSDLKDIILRLEYIIGNLRE